MNIKKALSVVVVAMYVFLFISAPINDVYAKDLSEAQSNTADTIAQICIENWETYGVLPSVCVGQAFIESTLGEYCSGYNLWGIQSGQEQYSSLWEGTIRYLNVINKSYYEGAPFKTDYHEQIRIILDGGYCQPVGSYYEDIIWSIDHYGFSKYDTQLFTYLEEKEKAEQERIEKEKAEAERLEQEKQKAKEEKIKKQKQAQKELEEQQKAIEEERKKLEEERNKLEAEKEELQKQQEKIINLIQVYNINDPTISQDIKDYINGNSEQEEDDDSTLDLFAGSCAITSKAWDELEEQ